MESPIMNERSARWGTYLIAFAITAALFSTAFFISDYFSSSRIAEIRATQDKISTDILSLETQFELLRERQCTDISENTILPQELSSLGSKLAYMEAEGSKNTEEVLRLKRLYSLLEIKDYLLMKQLATRCGLKPVFVLYYYSSADTCRDCEKQGYVLTALAEMYPQLRIYSFDYNLDVSALQTLVSIDKVENHQPALIINRSAYYGFHGILEIEKMLPQLAQLKKNATSTRKTSR